MNCSRCDKPNRGLEGLLPVDSGKRVELTNMTIYWWLCKPCLEKWKEHNAAEKAGGA